MPHILIIDHHDSFTYNLLELFRQQKNCKITTLFPEDLEENEINDFDGIVLSPGPGLPSEQKRTIAYLQQIICLNKPLLGVCLGHQMLIEYFGGSIRQLEQIVHGEATNIQIKGNKLYKNLPDSIKVGRYHSWIANELSFPKTLTINGKTNEGLIMSFEHKNLNIIGLQYHPESILTPQGKQIIANWLNFYVKSEF